MRLLSRWLSWTILLVIVGGLFIYFNVQIPWVSSWLGKLPGDMMITKNDVVIYFPIVSAALASLVISVILTLIFRR